MSRFADARRDGTYTPGAMGIQRPVTPAEMVAAMSAIGGGYYSGARTGPQSPALLYDADGKELGFEAFRSPIDAGPGFPLQPRLTDPSRPPREFSFSPGWNLVPTPRGEGGMTRFEEMRALSLACWQFRVAVNYRKKKIRGKQWEIAPKGDKTPAERKKFQSDIDRVTAFFQRPNPVDGLRFGEWIGQAVEEILTVDACPFFKYPAKDGSLHALVQIDGATIKPLIDEYAHVVGYQQILYGYPATQYPSYDPTLKRAVIRDADELAGRIAYIITNPNVTNVYGTSTLEQLRPTINVAIRRTARQLSWYQDGTVPDSFIEAPEGYTVDQIKQLQSLYTDLYAGNDALRAGMTVLPPGANYLPAKPFAFSKDESEEIISIICANEGIPRSIFVSQTNRATAEEQGNDAQDVGQKPIDGVLKDFLDDVIEHDLGAPDLGFEWVDERSGDQLKAAQAKQIACGGTWRTVDEIRADDGLDPMPEDEKPEAKAAKMAEIMGAQKKPGEKPAFGGKAPDEKKPEPDQEKAVLDELGEWKRFALKRIEKSKHTAAFETEAVSEVVRRFVVASLEKAKTAGDVRTVFEKASKLAAKRKAAQKQLQGALERTLALQRESLMWHAKNALEVAA